MKKSRQSLRDRRQKGKQREQDYRKERGCGSKKRMTEDQALAQAKRLEDQTGQKATAYRCRYAEHWHVGRERIRLQDGIVMIQKAER